MNPSALVRMSCRGWIAGAVQQSKLEMIREFNACWNCSCTGGRVLIVCFSKLSIASCLLSSLLCFFSVFITTSELSELVEGNWRLIKWVHSCRYSLTSTTGRLCWELHSEQEGSADKSSVKLDVSDAQREDESRVKIERGLLTGQKTAPGFTNLWWAEASKMTIRDKTALIETGPKPKRRVEPSEEITERKDKLFNLSLCQNESQRIS